MIYLLYCLVLHMLSGNYCCFCTFLLKRARMFSSYSRSCSKAQHQHYGKTHYGEQDGIHPRGYVGRYAAAARLLPPPGGRFSPSNPPLSRSMSSGAGYLPLAMYIRRSRTVQSFPYRYNKHCLINQC